MIKTCLSSAIARKLYNQEEFTTIVKEVENTVNSRPLTYQANDALDQQSCSWVPRMGMGTRTGTRVRVRVPTCRYGTNL